MKIMKMIKMMMIRMMMIIIMIVVPVMMVPLTYFCASCTNQVGVLTYCRKDDQLNMLCNEQNRTLQLHVGVLSCHETLFIRTHFFLKQQAKFSR